MAEKPTRTAKPAAKKQSAEAAKPAAPVAPQPRLVRWIILALLVLLIAGAAGWGWRSRNGERLHISGLMPPTQQAVISRTELGRKPGHLNIEVVSAGITDDTSPTEWTGAEADPKTKMVVSGIVGNTPVTQEESAANADRLTQLSQQVAQLEQQLNGLTSVATHMATNNRSTYQQLTAALEALAHNQRALAAAQRNPVDEKVLTAMQVRQYVTWLALQRQSGPVDAATLEPALAAAQQAGLTKLELQLQQLQSALKLNSAGLPQLLAQGAALQLPVIKDVDLAGTSLWERLKELLSQLVVIERVDDPAAQATTARQQALAHVKAVLAQGDVATAHQLLTQAPLENMSHGATALAQAMAGYLAQSELFAAILTPTGKAE